VDAPLASRTLSVHRLVLSQRVRLQPFDCLTDAHPRGAAGHITFSYELAGTGCGFQHCLMPYRFTMSSAARQMSTSEII
jgi:hypothetical protein